MEGAAIGMCWNECSQRVQLEVLRMSNCFTAKTLRVSGLGLAISSIAAKSMGDLSSHTGSGHQQMVSMRSVGSGLVVGFHCPAMSYGL